MRCHFWQLSLQNITYSTHSWTPQYSHLFPLISTFWILDEIRENKKSQTNFSVVSILTIHLPARFSDSKAKITSTVTNFCCYITNFLFESQSFFSHWRNHQKELSSSLYFLLQSSTKNSLCNCFNLLKPSSSSHQSSMTFFTPLQLLQPPEIFIIIASNNNITVLFISECIIYLTASFIAL